MRFFYADTGLQDYAGHHADACRLISRELRARGIETEVLAYRGVVDSLQRELGARPAGCRTVQHRARLVPQVGQTDHLTA